MFCENCGTEVKDTERFCPNCGTPVPSQPAQQPTGASAGPAPSSQSNLYGTLPDSQPQQPKAKGGLNIGILIAALVGAAVLVVLVVIVANFASINNFFHKTFSSPEDYYRFVEKKSVKEMASVTGDIYSNTVLETLDIYNQKVDDKISLKLGKEGQEYVELLGLLGMDMSWLQSVDIEVGYYMGDEITSLNLATSLNGDRIVSGEMLLDVEDETVYFQVPELSKTYVGIEMSDYLDRDMRRQLEEIAEQKEAREKLKEACPSQAEVEKIFSRYMNIALDQVDNVKKSEGTIKAEGIEQKCTELKVVIDGDTLEEIYISVLEAMMEDKELEKIITDVVDAADFDEDGEDVYDDFIDSLEDTIDYLERYSGDIDTEIVMTVYVDGKGEVKGRKIKITEEGYRGDEEYEITMLMPEKGKKFGYELSVRTETYGDAYNVSLIGSGQRSGDKITGDFRLKSNGTSLIDITVKNLDKETLKRGQLNGKLTVKPSSTIGKLMGMAGAGFSVGDLQFDIDAKTENKSYEYNLTVLYDDEELGQIAMSGKRQAASNVKAPKDVVYMEDMDDMIDWLEDADWNGFLKKLEKTDLPSEVIDELEDFVEMIEDGDLERMMNFSYPGLIGIL